MCLGKEKSQGPGQRSLPNYLDQADTDSLLKMVDKKKIF